MTPGALPLASVPSRTPQAVDEAHRLAQVEPVILATIRRKLAVSLRADDRSAANQDALEMANDARAAVLAWMRGAGCDADLDAHRAYVAATTRNACAEHVRRRASAWTQLKNRVRYLLNHDPRFALWRDREDTLVCGLASWTARSVVDPPFDALPSLSSTSPLAVLVPALFLRVGAPLELDALVEIVAAHQQVARGTVSLDAPGVVEAHALADAAPSVSEAVEHRSLLARLWSEVRALPIRQRVALLFNLRDDDGGDVLGLLAVTGVARLDAIAPVVGLSPEALTRLLPRLPLPDAEIARWLSMERQQVINLRKAARARLVRRVRVTPLEASR